MTEEANKEPQAPDPEDTSPEEEVRDSIRVVDGFELEEAYRSIYRPAAFIRDEKGRFHQLPRFFLEVPSEEFARKLRLTPHFALEEFLRVDLRETLPLRDFPRYVPVAVRVLAHYLERFRAECGEPVYVSVNGGYRSPQHQRPHRGDPHRWGVAVDIYRVGTTLIDNEEAHNHYARLATRLGEEVNIGVWADEEGCAEDHLHLDLGYMVMTPAYADEHPRVAEIIEDVPERRSRVDRRTHE